MELEASLWMTEHSMRMQDSDPVKRVQTVTEANANTGRVW